MALPRLEQPTFSLTIPSSGKTVRYRSFTVKEEKLLLIAQSEGTTDAYINVFKQLITNCCVDDIDVDKLASYDIEYFFINLRAKSVSNRIKLKIEDDHGKEVEVEVNLDEVQVHKSTLSNKILLDPIKDIGIKLQYPTFEQIAAITRREDGQVSLEDGLDMFASLIEVIWEGEAVYLATQSSKQEMQEFIEQFSDEQVQKVEAFLEDLPFVYIDIKFLDSKGTPQQKRVTGINSFFA